MRLFLDDIRDPKDCVSYMHTRIGNLNPIYLEDWTVVRNYNEFKTAILNAYGSGKTITHISFDHDLADDHYIPESHGFSDREYRKKMQHLREKTGYECAQWMLDFYRSNKIPLPIMFVHSMNPAGTKRIVELFRNA